MTNFFNTYGFFGFVKLVVSFLYTKIFFRQAKLIRLPFDIRNRKYIKIEKNFVTGFGCRIEAYPIDITNNCCIKIGSNVQINDYVHISGIKSVSIGNNVLIASKVFISDNNHGSYNMATSDSPLSIPKERNLTSKPILIEDNVWLGESVCVLSGVTIGKGAIVGALSVVTKNVDPYTIVAGNPSRIIKRFNFGTEKWENFK